MPTVGRHYVSTLAANGAILLLGTVGGILAARLLGPTGRGELAIVLLGPTALATLGTLGISQSLTFFTAQQPAKRHVLFSASLVLAAVQSLLLCGIGYFALPYLLREHRPELLYWARCFLLFIPLSLFSGYQLNLLQGALHLDGYNLSRIIAAVGNVLVLVVLFLLHRPDLGVIVIWQIVVNGVAALLNVWLVSKHFKLKWAWDPSILKPLFSYGLKTHLGGITWYLNQRLDQLIMSAWLVPEALGQYVVAGTLASSLTVIPNAIAIVTLPAAAREDSVKAQAVIRRSLQTVLLLGTASATVLLLITPFVLPILFGEAFRPAIDASRLLIVAMIPLSLSLVLYEGLRGLNHPLAPAFAEGIGNLVTVGLLAILLPRYSYLGAAIASLGAYTASFVAIAYFAWTRAGLSVPRLLWPAVSPPTAS